MLLEHSKAGGWFILGLFMAVVNKQMQIRDDRGFKDHSLFATLFR